MNIRTFTSVGLGRSVHKDNCALPTTNDNTVVLVVVVVVCLCPCNLLGITVDIGPSSSSSSSDKSSEIVQVLDDRD